MTDLADLRWRLRADFFAKDRDVVLQANRVFEGLGVPPIGGIILWSGAIVDIPTGYQLCDGSNGTPDLRDRFVVGAGSSYNVADTGGTSSNNLAHTHTFSATTEGPVPTQDMDLGTDGWTSTSGHTHDVSDTSDSKLGATENRPPYYALAFIQRMS